MIRAILRAMTRDEVLAKLRALKPWLEAQGVTRVRLFGSHARDEARPDSDVDLLIDVAPDRLRGFAYFALEKELGRRLGAGVSFVHEEGLNRVIRKHALADAIDA